MQHNDPDRLVSAKRGMLLVLGCDVQDGKIAAPPAGAIARNFDVSRSICEMERFRSLTHRPAALADSFDVSYCLTSQMDTIHLFHTFELFQLS
jgi:hypothetical protein